MVMKTQKISRVAKGGIALALIGAMWSVFFNSTCPACQTAAVGIGMRYLGIVGVCYYGVLGLLSLKREGRSFVTSGILAACGVHLVLVTYLLRNHIACLPCIVAAIGAFVAGVAVLCDESFNRKIHIWAFAAAFSFALVFAVLQTRAQDKIRFSAANSLLQELASQNRFSSSQDSTLLIVFTRDGCHFCEQFKSDYQPVLKKRLGDKLKIEYRRAPNNLPTPSFIVIGANTETLIGLPSISSFERTLARTS
jgi:hypothetical protein